MAQIMFRSFVIALVLAVPVAAADWPHWRGPGRDGLTGEPSGWSDGRWLPDRATWSANVGVGASSPLVVGRHVFVFGRATGNEVVRCLEAATGKEVWTAHYRAPEYSRFHNGDESFYAGPSSTPEYDPETSLLYTLGVDGDLNCWDTASDGKKVWSLNLYDTYKVKQRPKLTRAPMRDYGYTSSPLVHGERLLVEVGAPRGTLVAFDKKTGKEVWVSELTDEAGHNAGPTPITVEGVPCVALLTQRNLAVIRLDAGREGKTVATYPWVTDFANNIAAPAVKDNFVLVTAGYNQSATCKLKITLKGAEKVWQQKHHSKVCTPVVHGDHVYFVWQKIRCLDWETGEQRWEGGSFSDPGSCVVTGDDRLLVYGQNGKLALVETAKRSPKEYKELATRDNIFAAHAWPHVVLADSRIYCRDRDGHLVCFSIGK
jgi:outer membrane protein assembly factor BamB